jgi:SAM-dependent methyltransferase
MTSQAQQWSAAAKSYEEDFVDPYRPDVRSPLLEALRSLTEAGGKVVADLGCGIGPLLPFLADHFRTVYAVDFAEGMLARAREHCRGLDNITFLQRSLTDLTPLHGRLDVAVAVNSLVLPDVAELEQVLRQFRLCLRPGGTFVGIVPAMDAVHYYTMLLVDRARAAGKPTAAARKNAAHFGEHALYDFAFGQFCYQGLEQHFWQPFEVDYRLRKAGFRRVRRARVLLSWQQFACGESLSAELPPWDWFVRAEAPAVSKRGRDL